MNWWHDLTSAQGTVIGGVFVILAAVIAFGTGSLNRRAEDKRFHYTELKALYSQALAVAGELGNMPTAKASDGPEVQEYIANKVFDAAARMLSMSMELKLSGEYKTQSLLNEFISQEFSSGPLAPSQQDSASRASSAPLTLETVVQHCRGELAHFTPTGSRLWRVLRREISHKK